MQRNLESSDNPMTVADDFQTKAIKDISCSARKDVFGFPTRSDTNRAVPSSTLFVMDSTFILPDRLHTF